jgi:hypothetical protein
MGESSTARTQSGREIEALLKPDGSSHKITIQRINAIPRRSPVVGLCHPETYIPFFLEQNMRHVWCIVGLLLVGRHDVLPVLRTQEVEERPERPRNSQDVLAATGKFEKAVNGSAIVRNRCRFQGRDIEIEETAEVIEREGCKLVVRARKVTRAAVPRTAGGAAEGEKKSSTNRQPADGNEHSTNGDKRIEFMMYTDLSELTTPVLVEKEKFGQCEAGGAGVLKVSSRSEPGKAMQVIRRSEANGTTKEHDGVKQTRRDLSLFFSVPAAAEKARKALELAVKSCGGNEWPDEDDLP